MNVNLNGKTAIIITHDSMPGPPQETLRDYLLDKGISTILFIGHQNRYVINNPVKSSYFEIYKNGKKIKRVNAKEWKLPEAIAYIKDTVLTFYWIVKWGPKFIDYFFGLGNLNTFPGLLFRLFGKCNYVIYYVIDYMPQRFSNHFMNTVYHYIDACCASYAIATWNYGLGMIQARNKKWNKSFQRQLVVPHGVDIYKEAVVPLNENNRWNLVYMGTLYKQQGVDLIIKSLPIIRKKFPLISLTVIGIGPERNNLEQLAKKYKINSYITWLGFIQEPKEVDIIIGKSSLGLAPYIPNQGFVEYTEPGKVKRYLSCGIPVAMTNAHPIVEELIKAKCGYKIPTDSKGIAHVIINALENTTTLKKYRKNALLYAQQYTWEQILDNAFKETEKYDKAY